MLSFHTKFVQTDRQMDGRTMVKLYAPDLSMQGLQKKKKLIHMSLRRLLSLTWVNTSPISKRTVQLQFHGPNCQKYFTESCFFHPLLDLRGTRKVEIGHTKFHFPSKRVTSKSKKLKLLTWQFSNKSGKLSQDTPVLPEAVIIYEIS